MPKRIRFNFLLVILSRPIIFNRNKPRKARKTLRSLISTICPKGHEDFLFSCLREPELFKFLGWFRRKARFFLKLPYISIWFGKFHTETTTFELLSTNAVNKTFSFVADNLT